MTIGRLRFPFRERQAEATLLDDGCWQCPEVPSIVRVLDTLYSPTRDGLPADETSNRAHLQAAARWLKGTVDPDDDEASWN